jgi:hypothetical protein
MTFPLAGFRDILEGDCFPDTERNIEHHLSVEEPFMTADPTKGTVGELIEYLGPGLLADSCPGWPPDVFALSATVLRRSGAYVRILDLVLKEPVSANWPMEAQGLAEEWRRSINEALKTTSDFAEDSEGKLPIQVPARLQSCWETFQQSSAVPLAGVAADDSLCRALLILCLVADETASGIGVDVHDEDEFHQFAALEVLSENRLASLCLEIRPEKVRVLPKQHTSQKGITIRSLSHHLALCPATEVDVLWNAPYGTKELDLTNLLLLPWPLSLTPKDFVPVDPGASPVRVESNRFFSFQRKAEAGTGPDFERYLESALKQAKKFVERVEGIVFPELALSYQEYEIAERIAVREGALLIAGVNARTGEDGCKADTNLCVVQPAGLTPLVKKTEGTSKGQWFKFLRIRQSKHHRWCLDRSQVIQYGLGGVLPASKNCWELSSVERRDLNFVTLGSWLTLGVLICEDLARQDPVAEILRSVGPNLVIALLMDGPQLRNRWPSRYASVLTDDPGSSVLTLTSLGMSCRSRPAQATDRDRSRVIALWRDVRYGEQEIELPPEHNACVLSLVCESMQEFTADGRGDWFKAHFPVFAGYHSFRADGSLPKGRTLHYRGPRKEREESHAPG